MALFLFLLLVVTPFDVPSAAASSFGSDRENCEFALRMFEPSRDDIAVPSYEEFLQDLVIGPEVTFTSPILSRVDALIYGDETFQEEMSFTSVRDSYSELKALLMRKNSVTAEVADEILRFVGSVFSIKSGHLDVRDTKKGEAANRVLELSKPLKLPDGTLIHRQDVMFQLELVDGRSVAVSLENRCLEVNFPPQPLAGLEKFWEPIFSAALANGFQGTFQEGRGGGATQLNLGFQSRSRNWFLRYPRLIGRILKAPLVWPSLLAFFAPLDGHGLNGNFPVPLDFKNDARSIVAFDQLTDLLRYLPAQAEPNETGPFLKEIGRFLTGFAPQSVFDHYSYISAKKFKLDNPYIEIRFIRSLLTARELQLAAHFWSRLTYFAMLWPQWFETQKEQSVLTLSIPELKEEFTQVMKLIGIDEDDFDEYLELAHTRILRKVKTEIPAGLFPADRQPEVYLQVGGDTDAPGYVELYLPMDLSKDGEEIEYHSQPHFFTHRIAPSPVPGRYASVFRFFIPVFEERTHSVILAPTNDDALPLRAFNFTISPAPRGTNHRKISVKFTPFDLSEATPAEVFLTEFQVPVAFGDTHVGMPNDRIKSIRINGYDIPIQHRLTPRLLSIDLANEPKRKSGFDRPLVFVEIEYESGRRVWGSRLLATLQNLGPLYKQPSVVGAKAYLSAVRRFLFIPAGITAPPSEEKLSQLKDLFRDWFISAEDKELITETYLHEMFESAIADSD